jgi:HSP20 family protein
MGRRWLARRGEHPHSDRPVTLREAIDRLFEDSFVGGLAGGTAGMGFPAVDMHETADDYVLTASLPGVRPEDVDLTVSEGMVHLRGEVRRDEEVGEDQYLYRERSYGAFSRSIPLPAGVQANRAEATFRDGELSLRLPKAEEMKPRRIRITGAEKQAIPVEGEDAEAAEQEEDARSTGI